MTIKLIVIVAIIAALLVYTDLAKSLANGISRLGSYSITRNIEYGTSPHQKMDIYTSKDAKDSPVVVFFYGGNWATGSKDDYSFFAQSLTAQGMTVVIADYAKYPEHKFPAFVEDGANVLAWVRQNIAEYGGNSENTYVMGHSAGAYIAAILTLDESYIKAKGGNQSWIKGMIGLAGPYNFVLDEDYLHDLFGEADYPRSQPIYFARSDAPPIFLLHGKEDTTVGIYHSVNLEKKIQKLGGDVQGKYYDLDHRGIIASFAIPYRYTRTVLDDVVAFIASRS